MKIEKILYIDDRFENGMAAMTADKRIDFASDIEQIERPFGEYDCIITDMRMQHSESGFEVVERAIRAGKLPYVATGGTYEHGGTFNKVTVFNSDLVRTFDKMKKAEERFWKEALHFIDTNDRTATQQALGKVYGLLGIVPEDSVNMLMHLYRQNYVK